mmetsp:Transcript_6916/g.14144  ORF Transcript_6916/g.14144 Transcript_6916/m.14144 type:complete len:272 (+) Transcript_6916:531-1346(+)
MKENCVHRVSTGLECSSVDYRSRAQRINATFRGLFLRNASSLLLFGFTLLCIVAIIVELLSNCLVDVKHHNVENSIRIGFGRFAISVVRHKHKPVVAGHWAQRVAIAIQSLTEAAMAVQVGQLLVKTLVRKALVSGEVEVLSGIPNPVNFQSQLSTILDQDSNAAQKSRGAARFKYQHVRVHKERGFTQYISVQKSIGHTGDDGAASSFANAIQVRPSETTEANARFVLHVAGCGCQETRSHIYMIISDLTEYNLECFLGAFEHARVVSVD